MNITINNQLIEVEPGITILEAAKEAGIRIPTLCYLKEINEVSACRVCMVQVNKSCKLMPACSTKISDGMDIETDNEYIYAARRRTLELIASNHRMECTECPKGADCEFRDLCKVYGVYDKAYGVGNRKEMTDESTSYLVRNNSKCVLCRRCVSTCVNVQGIGAIAVNNKGADTNIGFPAGPKLSDTKCVACGQCVAACPTGALSVRDDTKAVWKALYNKNKFVVMAVSPAAAFSIGRLFGEKNYRNNGGKVAAILRRIGFELIIDTGAWDSGYEKMIMQHVVAYVRSGITPVLSSSSQSWKNYIHLYRPDLKERLLDVPSKSEYVAAQVRKQLTGRDVFYVSIDNSLSVKTADCENVDVHLTVRELFSLIRRACVSSFTAEKVWEETKYEPYDVLADQCVSRMPAELPALICEHIEIDGLLLRVARVSGLKNAAKALLNMENFDFIDVCGSPGGCLHGGGAPGLEPVWKG